MVTKQSVDDILDLLKPKVVRVGMLADEVLEIHPRSEMTRDPEVVGRDVENDRLIVLWHYPQFTLRIEHVKTNKLEGYAVQEINYAESEND